MLQSANVSANRGLSARSVRRFCAANGITKRKGADLDGIVAQSVSEVSVLYTMALAEGYIAGTFRLSGAITGRTPLLGDKLITS